MHTGRVYWITGLSGTGKSSLAVALQQRIQSQGHTVMLVDGDAVRELLLDNAGFDRESRLKIARFNARLCRFLSGQGVDVICATMSLFHEVQEWNRQHIEHYTEIFLDAPLEVLEKRDPKGIYKRARLGELSHVVGIHIAPEWPKNPDFSFTTDGVMTIQAMVEQVL